MYALIAQRRELGSYVRATGTMERIWGNQARTIRAPVRGSEYDLVDLDDFRNQEASGGPVES